MLRDESARLVGAVRGEIVPFPIAAPLRDIEKAWIHTCQHPRLRRRMNSEDFDVGTVEHAVLLGLERILDARLVSRVHVGVLVTHGTRGGRPNLNCAIATQLWTDAMKALEGVVSLRCEPLQ